jgi:long-subunit acyl-CoA synthetase (AMP-forming)
VIKSLQNFVISSLQLLVQCELYFLCFLPYVYVFDRVFGRGWLKGGKCCCPEGLR